MLNSINFFNRPISAKTFSGRSRSRFWLKCNSETFARDRKACWWMFWILLEAKSSNVRLLKLLKCFSLMLEIKFFFRNKFSRLFKLWKASDAILSESNWKQSNLSCTHGRRYIPMTFSERRRDFKLFRDLKSPLLIKLISFFDTSSSSNSLCSWTFGNSRSLLRERLMTENLRLYISLRDILTLDVPEFFKKIEGTYTKLNFTIIILIVAHLE